MYFKNKSDFHALGEALKKIRILNSTNPAILSQRLLYPIRLHPIFMSDYKFMSSKNIFISLFKSIALFLLFFMYAIFNLFTSLFRLNQNESLINSADSLFISHHVNDQVLRDDFYFNKWANSFLGNGQKVHFHYFKVGSNLELPNPISGESITSSFFSHNLKFYDELKIFKSLFFASIRFLKYFVLAKNQLEKFIYLELFSKTFSKSSLVNLRFYYELLNELNRENYKRIFYTMEGHAWESLLLLASQKINKEAHTYGYQHSAVFEDQITLLTPIPSLTPTSILTSGEGNNNFFHEYKKFGTSIITVGTSRTNEIKKSNNQTKNICLVVPEGIDSEIELMSNFVVECSALNKNISFLFQFHPASKNSKIVKNLAKRIQKSQLNISISETGIDESINQASYVIYRGSTAVVKCIMSGLIPLYLDVDNSYNIDPIYWTKKTHINSTESLEMTVSNSDISTDLINLENIQLKCSTYFQPFNIKALNKLQ